MSHYCRIILLPDQVRRLAEFVRDSPGAIHLHQDKDITVHVNDGTRKFAMDAEGRDVEFNPHQARLPLC